MIKWELQLFAEKTEPATARRRGEARSKGRVAKSMDLTTSLSLLAFLTGLRLFGGNLLNTLFNTMQLLFTNGILQASSTGGFSKEILGVLVNVGTALLPMILIGLLSSLVVTIAQTGLHFSPSVLIPDITRLNPLTGIQRFFSLNSLMELIKSTVKILIVGIVVYEVMVGIIQQLFQMDQGDPSYILGFYIQNALQLMFYVTGVYVVIAVFDLVFQRFSFERSLRMSKQEVKDEMKQNEGDPQIKGKIRQRGRSIAFRMMMKNVPQADVVITNPTHYAVALQYDAMTMNAPKVVAKGVDHVAFKIREIATSHDVPVVENRQLARTLYNSVELDEFIPGSLFAAVAEVLAYVYRLRGKAQ